MIIPQAFRFTYGVAPFQVDTIKQPLNTAQTQRAAFARLKGLLLRFDRLCVSVYRQKEVHANGAEQSH